MIEIKPLDSFVKRLNLRIERLNLEIKPLDFHMRGLQRNRVVGVFGVPQGDDGYFPARPVAHIFPASARK